MQGCSGDEREVAKSLADIISKREKNVIAEGQEPADFWVSLGGKSQYASSKRYNNISTPGTVNALFDMALSQNLLS